MAKKPVGRPQGKTGNSFAVGDSLDAVDAGDLRSWLSSFGTQEVQVKVIRKEPKTYKGVNTEGALRTYSELIDEETIRTNHGGGFFAVAVAKRDQNGNMNYFKQRSLKIAGPPRIDELTGEDQFSEKAAAPGEDNGLASQAMRTMKEMLDKADRNNNKSGFDPQLLHMMQAPMLAQMESMRESQSELRQAMAAKDAQIIALLTQKPDVPSGGTFQDKILGNMLENESTRLEGLRQRHDSELRQLKDNHKTDLDRVHEVAKEEMRAREKQHEREIDTFKESQRVSSESIKIAHEMRVDGLQSENKRLERDLAAAKIEIAELRAKKDKSLVDQAKEIAEVRDSLQLFSGKEEEEEKPAWERMVGHVMDNPDMVGQILGGIRGSGPQQAQPQQPQLPPPGVPFQAPDGQVYVMGNDGKAHRHRLPAPRTGPTLEQRKKAAAVKEAAAAPASGAVRPPSQTEITMATAFIETAAQNGTDPVAFAQTVGTAVPKDILKFIEQEGVDKFLSEHAHLAETSYLRTQAGRNFVRKVFKYLLEGSVD